MAEERSIWEDVEDLGQLQRHPGWAILCREAKKREEALLSEMRLTTDPGKLSAVAAQFLLFHDLPDMPARLAEVLRRMGEKAKTSAPVNR